MSSSQKCPVNFRKFSYYNRRHAVCTKTGNYFEVRLAWLEIGGRSGVVAPGGKMTVLNEKFHFLRSRNVI